LPAEIPHYVRDFGWRLPLRSRRQTASGSSLSGSANRLLQRSLTAFGTSAGGSRRLRAQHAQTADSSSLALLGMTKDDFVLQVRTTTRLSFTMPA